MSLKALSLSRGSRNPAVQPSPDGKNIYLPLNE